MIEELSFNNLRRQQQAAFPEAESVTELVISPTGTARCVYSEIIDVRSLGRLTIQRGSHVEPTADGRWTADLAPVNGPRLGPFVTRSAALHAEQIWLREHWLTANSQPLNTDAPSVGELIIPSASAR